MASPSPYPSHTIPLPFLLLFTLFLSFAASQSTTCDRPLGTCDDSIDRFPEDKRINIKYANQTIRRVKYFTNFVDVDIRVDDLRFAYRFVICGCRAGDASKRQVVFINPLSFYIEDGPALAFYHFLASDKIGLIKAVSKRDTIFNQEIRDHISSGGAVEVQDENFANNYSRVRDQSPSLSMIGTFSILAYRDAELDIPFLVVAEAQEKNPLARAEWMKIIGLVLDRPDKANEEFEVIENRYNQAKEKAAKAVRRPAVFFNRPQEKFNPGPTVDERYNWIQPVADEYIVQFVSDANADYRYIDEESIAGETGLPLNISTIVRDFKSADYLLQSNYFPGNSSRTLEDYLNDMVVATDPDAEATKQVEMLKAVRCAQVWNTQKRGTSDGQADDFFESAAVRPDIMLSDFIQALHPYLDFADRETFYIYRYKETKNVPKKCPFTVLNGTAPTGTEFIDTKFAVPDLDRYQIADRIEDKVFPAIKKRMDEPFEVFFHHEDVSEDVTVVTVRVQVNSTEKESFANTSNVVLGMRESLGDNVRQLNETISESETGDEVGGGLSGGAIAGIVIGVIVAVLVIGVVLYKRRRRSRMPIQEPLALEPYWDEPDAAGGRH